VASPLQQFEIKTIASAHVGGVNVSFTNSSLFMLIAITAITAFLVIGVRKRAMVPGRMQSLAELSYEFIAGLVRDNVGHAGRAYFPFIFTLFMFILFCNTIGLIPYTFTVTSHIIVTFALAAIVFIGVTIIGIVKHRMKWFSYFFPPGAPLYMAPLLVPIEVLSYLARPVTLSLRLFANMMAGHTMLKVFGAFVVALGFLGGWAPLAFMVAFTGLEILVAFLQAYVFAILTCIYLNDALHMHH
jgi:F-type H+-transporting ATPase subunit a